MRKNEIELIDAVLEINRIAGPIATSEEFRSALQHLIKVLTVPVIWPASPVQQ